MKVKGGGGGGGGGGRRERHNKGEREKISKGKIFQFNKLHPFCSVWNTTLGGVCPPPSVYRQILYWGPVLHQSQPLTRSW